MQDKDRNSNKDSNMDNDMNNYANNNVNEQPLSDDKRLREMYDKLVGYEKTIHERNQKRIKIGLRCIYIIPLFFLVLLMIVPDSSKIIFLVLWIVSLFAIAVYLIGVEYVDYKLQEKMNDVEDRYYKQFAAMESALAELQASQSSLSSLFGTGSN